MPLTLTTALNTGDLDSSNYDTVKISNVELNLNAGRLTFRCYKGYMDSGDFVAGKLDPESYTVEDTDFDTMKDALSQTDEKVYDGVARLLYQWLIDEGHYVGSIT